MWKEVAGGANPRVRPYIAAMTRQGTRAAPDAAPVLLITDRKDDS